PASRVSRCSFSDCHAHPRRLPSFPTRRSSDLGQFRKIRVTQSVVGRRRSDSGSQDRKRGRAPLPSQEEGTGRVFQRILDLVQPRSEEHTSELQSRENLVCRLLLEKKKKVKQRR